VHDQKEALKARPPAAHRRRLVLGAAALGVVAVAPRLLRAVAAPAPTAPSPPTTPEQSQGVVLMDLAAIKRVVRGRGRPVLVHFWASWCGPCLEELPLIDQLARDVRARGVDLISLSLDKPERAADRVVRVLSESAPSLTRNIVNIDDADAFISAIDPRWEGAIPALFAYDSKGQLRGRLIGEASRRDLDRLVSRLVKPGTGSVK
jgi:thiol-disulfide isomerase/thioredoxin